MKRMERFHTAQELYARTCAYIEEKEKERLKRLDTVIGCSVAVGLLLFWVVWLLNV